MQFVKFPNNKVWRVDENGWFAGSLLVSNYENIDNLEDRLDAIAEAATGSSVGLTDFAYKYHGCDIVSFHGFAESLPDNEDDYAEEGFLRLKSESESLWAAIAKQYGLTQVEVQHVINNLDSDYGEECVLEILGSQRQIRSPSHPEERTYVRIVVDGLEIAYWVEDEWRDAPGEVMGALIGAAKSK